MIDLIHRGLIVSCQARPGEALASPDVMAKMAVAAAAGGACAIRAAGVADINAVMAAVDVPVIGLVKNRYPGIDIYITPTTKEVRELLKTGCAAIAMDATGRTRPGGERPEDLLALVKSRNIISVADISTYEEGKRAEAMGFDIVATTLSGYTPYSRQRSCPDYMLIKKLVYSLHIPVLAEGKIFDRRQLKKVLNIGPHAVVIGTAITRPQAITERFVRIFKER